MAIHQHGSKREKAKSSKVKKAKATLKTRSDSIQKLMKG